METYLIVGLGNPEPKYLKTRHNMGFDVINKMAEKYDVKLIKNRFKAMYESVFINEKKILLVKPQTYMNLSGEAVKKYVNFYKIPLKNILVVYDDMDTEIGDIRVRAKGGPGTHNGMKSVVSELETEDFSRIRVGIGRPKAGTDIMEYVIGNIPDEEYMKLQESQEKAVEAIVYFLENGIDNTMNIFNK